MRSIRQSKAGFTLLETLIAFTVFSLFMIAVHKSFLTGVRGQDASGWSDAIGQAVRSEFALIEAGAISAMSYSKILGDTHRLNVELTELSVSGGSIPLAPSGLNIARIDVTKLDDGSMITFRKIVTRK